MRKGDFAEAAALLEQGLTLDADRAAFLVKLGEVRLELKQIDAAEKALTEALKEKSDQAMAHFNLGLVHEARGDLPGRDRRVRGRDRGEPEALPAALQPGEAAAPRAGRPQDAITHFRAAVEKKPDFGTGYLYLAKALLDAGDLKGAEQAATRGLALGARSGHGPARPLRAGGRLLAPGPRRRCATRGGGRPAGRTPGQTGRR